ncbi:MerR family transcriptional regulator [Dysosmobacter sp.]|uniref:MerR family transcriptional regulator n=1 Tax=Dysosmobacter sp. TaxID=2591382 RepID=UPI002A8EF592|nr:MerR family transcriptional regulator [Dysosmobacter sp.]MDY3281790.1 MerR family transcriptional regulator [Dysosmobacter sp.]
MKQACEKTGLPYETLKFYCNQGLIPNVKRDAMNRRVFDDRDVAWTQSLQCLKSCGMSLAEMKEYLALCLMGEESISRRKAILAEKREALLERQRQVQSCMDYIDRKQAFYDAVLSGETPYVSNLIDTDR